MNDQKKIEEKMNQAKNVPCILCGKKPFCVGQYIPYNSKMFGTKKGKQKIVFYSLCQECTFIPDSYKEVASLIMLYSCGCKGAA